MSSENFIPKKIAIIGAGPMGLATALYLAEDEHQVTVFEADDRIGGMSAQFNFDGLNIERYYHFVCKTDYVLFDYLQELELEDKLKWTSTKMGFYFKDKLFKWGTPSALLSFPGLTFIQKVRYALQVMYTKSINNWESLDKEYAHVWLKKWIGSDAYKVLWEPLFYYKFYEYAESLSAAWIGTRIKRVALSRKSIFEEQLGYLEGGSETVLNSVADKFKSLNGKIRLSTPVQEVVNEGNKVTGLKTKDGFEAFDAVISTAPVQYVPRLVPALPLDEKKKIEDIQNVAVACVILKLKLKFTENFWTNINADGIEIPGLIEYTNLRPMQQNGKDVHVLYAPFYMPKTHPKYSRDGAEFIKDTVAAMKKIRPDFRDSDIIAAMCHKYEFSQTVCTPGFFDKLPPIKSELEGLFYADTSYHYPEDRSITESFGVGERVAEEVLDWCYGG